ncbi:MAG: hypothetical protein V4721_10480 [Bacteroidota bacterium]
MKTNDQERLTAEEKRYADIHSILIEFENSPKSTFPDTINKIESVFASQQPVEGKSVKDFLIDRGYEFENEISKGVVEILLADFASQTHKKEEVKDGFEVFLENIITKNEDKTGEAKTIVLIVRSILSKYQKLSSPVHQEGKWSKEYTKHVIDTINECPVIECDYPKCKCAPQSDRDKQEGENK